MNIDENKLLKLALELVEKQKKDKELIRKPCCTHCNYVQNALRKLQATIEGDPAWLWRRWGIK